ncbi:MAG: hypothetical protein ACE5FP_10540, partial [Gemmatimonadota bacterium]
MKRFRSFAVLLLLGAWGCTEDPVSPAAESEATADAATPALSVQGFAGRTVVPRYIVAYNGRTPRDLAATVESAGGVIDATYEEYGFAIVSGIDAEGAASIAALSGVIDAEEEPIFRLPEPEIGGFQSADGMLASNANPAAAFFFPIQW